MSKEFDQYERMRRDFSEEELWEELRVLLQPLERTSTIVNPGKFYQMRFCYLVLSRLLAKTSGAKVEYEVDKPFPTNGVVTAEAPKLPFADSLWFARAVEGARNFEIYPKTDGTVHMNILFDGVTIPLGEVSL